MYPKRSSTVGVRRQKQPTVQTTQCLKHIFSQTIVKFEHFVNKVNEMLTLVEPPASSLNRLQSINRPLENNFLKSFS
jgi:hypothetical protein